MQTKIHILLKESATIPQDRHAAFFKTGPGEYAEHDQFLGVTTPILRILARSLDQLSLKDLSQVIASPYNESRLLALLILVKQYNKATLEEKNRIFQFYQDNLQHINNWNLVDSSAHLILGAHLETSDKTLLLDLAKSKVLWERRVAIVATWHYIKKGDFEWTFKIAKMLLNDPHDLIHKATGWMLREAGKKDIKKLITFLDEHAKKMPRTMLRYAVEKFPKETRLKYYSR